MKWEKGAKGEGEKWRKSKGAKGMEESERRERGKGRFERANRKGSGKVGNDEYRTTQNYLPT